MNLTEGQLFTIEALNRIDGFVWPEGAKFAGMCEEPFCVSFYSAMPVVSKKSDNSALFLDDEFIYVDFNHPDWRNSLITREQFDSVGWWVRNDGNEPVISGDFDLMFDDGEIISHSEFGTDGWDWSVPCNDGVAITHWRYHRPTKETEMHNPKPYKKPDCIETLIDKRKDAIEQKRLALAALEEAEAKERELMLSIQAWAESYGFDIRVLDESDEVPDPEPNPEPELVIADWRDLRVGDEIMIGPYLTSKGEIISVDHVNATARPANGFPSVTISDVSLVVWKFLRRPSNK